MEEGQKGRRKKIKEGRRRGRREMGEKRGRGEIQWCITYATTMDQLSGVIPTAKVSEFTL